METMNNMELAEKIFDSLSDGYDDEENRSETIVALYHELADIPNDSFVKAAFKRLGERVEELTDCLYESDFEYTEKEKAQKIMENLVHKRFDNRKDIEKYIREQSDRTLPNLVIGHMQKCDYTDMPTDDFMDCCFGEGEYGMDYPDFIIYFIKTRAKRIIYNRS